MCDNCGGPSRWLLVDRDKWKYTKKYLNKCEECGYYSFCAYCARGSEDIKYNSYGDDYELEPNVIEDNEKLVRVKISWCG